MQNNRARRYSDKPFVTDLVYRHFCVEVNGRKPPGRLSERRVYAGVFRVGALRVKQRLIIKRFQSELLAKIFVSISKHPDHFKAPHVPMYVIVIVVKK